nr:ASB_HP1_G0027030.mRNA.1.CDS.1 [Saccharomyces cerevisiae]CAI6461702.1 ASB_HP1_G0027100.mRNA.1.CDS.1 [Saccharomyces cerevisiae]
MSALSKIHEFIKVPPGEGLEDVTYLRNKDIIPMGPKKKNMGYLVAYLLLVHHKCHHFDLDRRFFVALLGSHRG